MSEVAERAAVVSQAAGDASADDDAAALRCLDELLAATLTQRQRHLARLAQETPVLHARVQRLIEASAAGTHTLQRPIAQTLAALAGEPVAAGAVFGAYRLLREIGRGGMSSVWLGEHTGGVLKRPVAVKIPLVSLGSEADRERFARERDVLAGLDHPHIARLIDAGLADAGQPFIVLEHVEGEPLLVACETLDLPARLRLFLQVLDAVGHAHRQLVVHRDLKPSNLLVDARGQVRLLDFGIAKLLEGHQLAAASSELTAAVGCAATPRYAAPEQLEGGAITTATDVYALGVLLFELLTGEPPYRAAPLPMAGWLRAVLHEPARRPSETGTRWHGQLRGDLDNIVATALHKRPQDRYGSVAQLAQDLRCWLAHRPVSVGSPAALHRLRLWLRRHRAAGVAAGLGLAATLSFAGLAAQQYGQTRDAALRADRVRDFMFELVEDAEADGTAPAAERTGREMVAAAVVRARAGFDDQPLLRGELLAELGRMQLRLGDTRAGAGLLDEAHALLARHAPAGDAALNKARAYLASRQLGEGHLEAAAELASEVLARCRQPGAGCAKARYYAGTVLARVALRRGETGVALAHMNQGVRDAEAGFGPQHAETALALLGAAVVARQAGQLMPAQASLAQALEVARRVSLKPADRVQLSRTRAVLSLDLGDYAGALQALRVLDSPALEPGERALVWRLRANVELALGRPEAALQAAQIALAAAPTDEGDPERWLALQARARGLSLLGEWQAAAQALAEVAQGLGAAGYGERSMEQLRVQRLQAENLARAGQLQPALAALQVLAADAAGLRSAQPLEYAQTLDLLGAVLREAGEPAQALVQHAAASALLAHGLPVGHPWRERNALYAAAARQALEADADARWPQRVAAYVGRFPEGSSWRLLAQRAGPAAACRNGCGLYL